MSIIVHSPHTGRAVKVRDQDIGRAVRDDRGHVFYPLSKSDGSGYYGSRTRTGNPAEEQHALQVQAQPPDPPEPPEPPAPTTDQAGPPPSNVVHDATGKRSLRSGRIGLILTLLALVGLGLAVAAAWTVLQSHGPLLSPQTDLSHPDPAVPPPTPSAPQADPVQEIPAKR